MTIEKGDHVLVGPLGKTHWLVLSVQHGFAKLSSGMTERRSQQPLDRLTIFKKGNPSD